MSIVRGLGGQSEPDACVDLYGLPTGTRLRWATVAALSPPLKYGRIPATDDHSVLGEKLSCSLTIGSADGQAQATHHVRVGPTWRELKERREWRRHVVRHQPPLPSDRTESIVIHRQCATPHDWTGLPDVSLSPRGSWRFNLLSHRCRLGGAHAAASLWLNAGVQPTEVARRLGHGVAVLLRVYANYVDGGDGDDGGDDGDDDDDDDSMNDKIGDALR